MRRAPGSLEREVVELLVSSGDALSPGEVSRRLPGELAYTTVMTVLARLAEKGVLEREKVGRGFAYRAVTDLAQQTAWEMSQILARRPDRAQVLRRFVSTLSETDERLLQQLLHPPDADPAGA